MNLDDDDLWHEFNNTEPVAEEPKLRESLEDRVTRWCWIVVGGFVVLIVSIMLATLLYNSLMGLVSP